MEPAIATANITSTTMTPPRIASFGIPEGDLAACAPEAASGAVGSEVAPELAAEELDEPSLDAADAGTLAATPSTAPHFVQNFVSPTRGVPHFVQNRLAATDSPASLRRAPHLVQNASRSVRAAPHCLQLIAIATPVQQRLDRTRHSGQSCEYPLSAVIS